MKTFVNMAGNFKNQFVLLLAASAESGASYPSK